MFSILTLLVLTLPSDGASDSAPEPAPRSYRMIDVNGDGQLDRLQVDSAGSLSISINRGGRQFEPIVQELPQVSVNDVLAEDLNGDGHTDLYLVSRGANAALLGDGSGMFVSDGGELGLTDAGVGLRAERVDVDGDGVADLLLHNLGGDVVFWGSGTHTFERDPAAPEGTPEVLPAVLATPVAAGPVPVGTVDEASTGPREASFARPSEASSAHRGRSGGARVPVESSAPAGGTIASGGGGGLNPSIEEVVQIPFPPCASGVTDATSGTCLSADSVPAFGTLYPLGMEFNILPTGEIGMGTTLPESGLHLANALDSELRISPNTTLLNQGAPSIFLSEGLGINCGWRLSYDGTSSDNPFRIISECTTPQTRLAINRSTGVVLVGSDDFGQTAAGPGLLRVDGDVSQARASDGMVKAAVHVNGTGTAAITRSFNNLPGSFGSVTLTDLGVGRYEVNFGASVLDRYYIGTIGAGTPSNAANGIIEVTPRSGNANAVFIEIVDGSGVFTDSQFFITIL